MTPKSTADSKLEKEWHFCRSKTDDKLRSNFNETLDLANVRSVKETLAHVEMCHPGDIFGFFFLVSISIVIAAHRLY